MAVGSTGLLQCGLSHAPVFQSDVFRQSSNDSYRLAFTPLLLVSLRFVGVVGYCAFLIRACRRQLVREWFTARPIPSNRVLNVWVLPAPMYRRGRVAGAPVPPSARSFRSVTAQLGLKRFRIASCGNGSALGFFHAGLSLLCGVVICQGSP